MRGRKPFLNLQTTITLLVWGVVAIALFMTNLLISHDVGNATKKNLSDQAMTVARMMAHTTVVKETLEGKRTNSELEAFTNQMMAVAHVEFIVVMDMNGIRKSHPNPSKIGKRFVGGDEGPVLQGDESISTAKGTLGYSLRAFTPVYSDQGKQIGAVSVGISLDNVHLAISKSKQLIYYSVILGLIIGIIGALILAGKIKKSTFGLEPFEIGKLLEERSAMLQSINEGMLAIGPDARITLINDEALHLLKEAGIHSPTLGTEVKDVIPHFQLEQVLDLGHPQINKEIYLNGVTFIANQMPIIVDHKKVGAITTFRNKTEINKLAEELTGVKLYADALRAQSHEFMNKLHVILGLVQLQHYEKLGEYINQISYQIQSEVGFIVKKVKDPALAGFILGKLSYSRECGVDLTFNMEGSLPESDDPNMTHELITILGNLINNAFEAVQEQENKKVSVHFDLFDDRLSVEVSDNGPGINDPILKKLGIKGISTKGTDRGLGLSLVRNSLIRLNGQLEISSEAEKGTCFSLSIPYKLKEDI